MRFRADRRKESQSRRRSSLGSRTFRPLREQWRLITGTLGGMISSEKLKVTVCLAGTGASCSVASCSSERCSLDMLALCGWSSNMLRITHFMA